MMNVGHVAFFFGLLTVGLTVTRSDVVPGIAERDPESSKILHLRTCVGHSLDIYWGYPQNTKETFNSITWYFRGNGSEFEQLLATWSPSRGFNASDERVSHLGNGSISIANLTISDDGYVNVEYRLEEDSVNAREIQHAVIHVRVPPKLRDDQLTLRLDTNPYTTSDGVHPGTMRCGYFMDRGTPPVYPTLQGPNGLSIQLQDHVEHECIYPLPIDRDNKGNYTCTLPDDPFCKTPEMSATIEVE
ncbi:uncharacterized protein [Littorina saxatilis]|uniref:Immunoglobulin V-set domain-containing protein n=1 Tax=Littorina saxatilis TaxID=31220 RepID=A0AAN9BMB3_9CAEN